MQPMQLSIFNRSENTPHTMKINRQINTNKYVLNQIPVEILEWSYLIFINFENYRSICHDHWESWYEFREMLKNATFETGKEDLISSPIYSSRNNRSQCELQFASKEWEFKYLPERGSY